MSSITLNPATSTQHKTSTTKPTISLLATSLPTEHAYNAEIEGILPTDLNGALFRNGPGLFERDGYRKKNLLDGDGMIQKISIANGKATYQNHFVRTPKYLAEEKAGKFLYPTWTTLAPKFHQNIPGFPTKTQAGVVATVRNNTLYALDEVGMPWQLNPADLSDQGSYRLTEKGAAASYKAHNKIDGRNGDWVFLGWSETKTSVAQILIKDKQGTTQLIRNIPMPTRSYVHDFFITENYVVINLHPVIMKPLSLLVGRRSYKDCLSWQPELGNKICIIERKAQGHVQFFDAPAAFMWHVFNAYEEDNKIIADFVGYDEPDHLIGDDPFLTAVMTGGEGQPSKPGTVRRHIIDIDQNKATEQILFEGNYEFPIIHFAHTGYKHRFGFGTSGDIGKFGHNALVRFDFANMTMRKLFLGPNTQVGEPVYATQSMTDNGRGYLLSMCLDENSGKSFVAVVDAESMDLTAKILLKHHTPLSFHGCWQPSEKMHVAN